MDCKRYCQQHNRQGFTLVEILVVVILLVALMAIALPILLNQRGKAREVSAKSAVNNTYKALKAEYATGELYSTAVISSVITNEPALKVTMAAVGSSPSYSQNNVEVSLVNSQTVMVNGASSNGKQVLLLASENKPNPVSRLQAVAITQNTNLIPNPSFENNITDGGANANLSGGTSTVSSSWYGGWASSGTHSMRGQMTAPGGGSNIKYNMVIPATPGTTYSCSSTVKLLGYSGTGASVSTEISFLHSGFGALQHVGGTSHSMTVGSAERLAVTNAVAPASTAYVWFTFMYIRPGGPGTGQVDAAADSVMCVASPTSPTYFDGDSAGAFWNGASNNSTSTGYVGNSW